MAAERWPRDGTPTNPSAWLITTGRNRALDRLRRDGHWRRRRRCSGRRDEAGGPEVTDVPDERLELIFTCCHPALAIEAQVALTLRTLGGLTTARDRAGLPRAGGDDGAAAGARQAQDPQRRHPLPGAAAASSCPSGWLPCWPWSTYVQPGVRPSAAAWPAEALWLVARRWPSCCPQEPEPHGLLALMLLHDSRRTPASPRRRAGAARGPGPVAVGRRGRSPRARPRCSGRCAGRPRAVRPAGRDRRPAHRGDDRLGASGRALRRAGPGHRVAGRAAEPGRRGRRGRGPRGGAAARGRAAAGRVPVPARHSRRPAAAAATATTRLQRGVPAGAAS